MKRLLVAVVVAVPYRWFFVVVLNVGVLAFSK